MSAPDWSADQWVGVLMAAAMVAWLAGAVVGKWLDRRAEVGG